MRVAILVAGGIAAYKLVDLASALTQAGCEVRVAMTQSATRFVGPPSFRGVTGNPVITSLWSEGGEPEPHVFLGDWAQVILLAPATANVIGRVAGGLTDDVVTATLTAARCPVVVAPAMNDAMWSKPAVQENLGVLRQRGIVVVQPGSGHLASGHSGEGRLPDSSALLQAMATAVRGRYDLAGRRVVVSAGGTREPIDPVRYIGNYSSGKMGFALAEAAADRGAQVRLVTTVAHQPHRGVHDQRVETADQMLAELHQDLAGADLLVMAAAVADFRPAQPAATKLRRGDGLTLRLEPTPDLLAATAAASRRLRPLPVIVGFAAETGSLARAADKLEHKGLDLLVANDVAEPGSGFGTETNRVTLLAADGPAEAWPLLTKRDVADRLLDRLVARLDARDAAAQTGPSEVPQESRS
jgi:phosphopantothenoylcysteine decarboxylase/phosphopantothenate--cysteine ligase